jgi:hypothetical protein
MAPVLADQRENARGGGPKNPANARKAVLLRGDNAAVTRWADPLTWTGRFFIAPNQFSRATDRHLLAFSGSASIQRESKTKRTAPGVV